ncbi:MAG: aspartate carbamoyltransferase regulatory subunit [Nanoarchaeota archaeon]|nr:aspartate carbamoyltransferase regulatory subunit [Nanoarchaeota archaeon]
MSKELKVSAIRQGTVIDHIPAKAAFDVVEILRLKQHKGVVSVATNLQSKSLGKKGIVKVGGRELTKREVDEITIVAPTASINIIENYEVKKKSRVEIPEKFNNIIKCSNPSCVTNNEKVKTSFSVLAKEPLKVICGHCERVMGTEDIELI